MNFACSSTGREGTIFGGGDGSLADSSSILAQSIRTVGAPVGPYSAFDYSELVMEYESAR